MAQDGKEGIVLGITLLITAGLAGAGYFIFTGSAPSPENPSVSTNVSSTSNTGSDSANPTVVASANQLNLDTSLPNPDTLALDGSVTMAGIVRELRNGFRSVNPNVPVTYGIPNNKPGGTNKGLRNLLDGNVVIAASSRTLKPEEAKAGIKLIPIAKDALAIAVGIDNPFQGSLTQAQVKDIYTGKITNWSQVGGPNVPIKVINRARASGTRDVFQELVLQYAEFAPDGPNFITLTRDETTPMLRMLGNNGIGYSTIAQIKGQQTVRLVPINGIAPTDTAKVQSGEYPIARSLYLAVPPKTSPVVKEFIEFALSPEGQKAIERAGYIPVR
jgi:phosphate transport system substrate-binding protein